MTFDQDLKPEDRVFNCADSVLEQTQLDMSFVVCTLSRIIAGNSDTQEPNIVNIVSLRTTTVEYLVLEVITKNFKFFLKKISTDFWVVSFELAKPITIDFKNLFDQTLSIQPEHSKGLGDDKIYDPYATNKQKFSIQGVDSYQLYTICHLINFELNPA